MIALGLFFVGAGIALGGLFIGFGLGDLGEQVSDAIRSNGRVAPPKTGA